MRFAVLIVITATMLPSLASAQNYYGRQQGYGSNSSSSQTQGHFRGNGTYVEGYQRTSPNNTQMDNYNTRGNSNPYTGNQGSRTPKF